MWRWKTFSAKPCSVYPLFNEIRHVLWLMHNQLFSTRIFFTISNSSANRTSSNISTIFFAHIFWTAVLPIWDILTIYLAGIRNKIAVASSSYQSAHSLLCFTRNMGNNCHNFSKLCLLIFYSICPPLVCIYFSHLLSLWHFQCASGVYYFWLKLLAITTRKNKSNLIGLVSFYFYKEFT